MKVAIFLGPTLAIAEAGALLDATYLPPATQGDIYRIVRDSRPQIIGLVDGYFRDVAAVWHREILFALSEGVHVFGASSMGALRAAELHSFGMLGVGRIFEAYRDGAYFPFPPPFERDEEVAIEHGPADSGYLAVTDALVDIRATLLEAQRAGLLSESATAKLINIASDIHFADRTYDAILEIAARSRIEGLDCARFAQWVTRNKVSQKARDARAMLAHIKQFSDDRVEALQPTFRFERALVWERFLDACDRDDDAKLSETDKAILDELRLDSAMFATLSQEARLHHAAVGPFRSDRVAASAQDERLGLDRLRARHALPRRVDLDAWMRLNAIDERTIRRLVADEATIARLPTAPARAILNRARAAGATAPLYARAMDKQRVLSKTPEAQRKPTPLEKAPLIAWSLENTTLAVDPDDLPACARTLGFDDEEALVNGLWRERLYLTRKDGNS
jgi:hypothetical protein